MTDLPRGWAEVPLGEIVDMIRGITFTKAERRDDQALGYVACLRTSNVQRTLETHDLAFIPRENVRGDHQFVRSGDVVVSMSNSFELVGKAAIADDEHAGMTFGAFLAVLRSKAIEPELLLRLFRSEAFLRSLRGTASQTTNIANISAKRMAELPIVLPPVPEQRRIIAKIGSLTGKSKRARDQLDHIPRLVEKYKQAVLAAAFRGDLTREWAATQPNGVAGGMNALTRVRNERDAARVKGGLRSKGRNRSVPSKVVDLIKLPRTWTWLTFDDCSWDMTVGHVGPMKDRYIGEGIPFLRSLNVRANRVELRKVVFIDQTFNDELKKSRLHPGDLVVVRTGEPGVAAVIPPELAEANCSDLVICRLIRSANPHFAAYYMNSDYAKSVVAGFQVGVAQQHFNVGAMSEMPLPFAPIEEQTEIVRRIEIAFTWIKRLASEATSARTLIDHLDLAVLAKAFRGELVAQDPADEPASVLLERIRAERGAAPKAKRGRRAATAD